MNRKALIVGIDDYPHSPLPGSVKGAKRMKEILSRHAPVDDDDDGAKNFFCGEPLISSEQTVTKILLKSRLIQLFQNEEAEVILFYFCGHGVENEAGSYLMTQDGYPYDEGVSVHEIAHLAGNSPAKEIIIILDCCYSGNIGNFLSDDNALIRKGMSIITSSSGNQISEQRHGTSLFTSFVCAALEGGAADILGQVNIADVYAYVDRLLTPLEQRPYFKAHVSHLVNLRNCKRRIEEHLLRKIEDYFPSVDYLFPLDPSYEPTAEPKNKENETVFGHLQKFTSLGLVTPMGEDHMYFAAMNGKPCRLTPKGQLYWKMVIMDQI